MIVLSNGRKTRFDMFLFDTIEADHFPVVVHQKIMLAGVLEQVHICDAVSL